MTAKLRLDELLLAGGFYPTLEAAYRACLAGSVMVDGATVTQPGTPVSQTAQLQIKSSKRFVSRGGEKLAGALESFCYDPSGLTCIDVGASSGGFTDCLLQNGAGAVTAVDVGYGQFDWRLRQDPRVSLFERTNISLVSSEELGGPFELLVADLSFTGIARLAAKFQELLKNQNDGFVLVKPQFELPKALVKDGVVKNPKNHQEAIEIASEALISANLAPVNLVASKLLGPKGNLEFFLWVKKAGITANIDIEKVVQEAHLNQDQ